MVEPKIFYRELDAMMSSIRTGRSDKNFFCNILRELKRTFGDSLKIYNSHVYEMRGDEYILIDSSDGNIEKNVHQRIPVISNAIQEVLRHGNIIYNDPALAGDILLPNSDGSMTPAAISVHNPVRKWLFIFELTTGWTHEEIKLFLNAVRTAINYRLFSEMMENDFKRAEQIQKSLLPRVAPKVEGYQIYGHSHPAEIVGGDFFDYFQFDADDFGGCIGDASGHGLPAALLVRDVVIGLRMGLAKEMRLGHTLNKLNQVIQQSTYSTSFVSLFIGEIEKEGHLFYINAGHPPPFIINGDTIHDLKATGITLGFMNETDFGRSYMYMEHGSILVLYTDGIVERQDKNEEQYEVSRLKELVVKNSKKSPEEIVKLVFKSVYDFGGRTTWEDDATMMVVKRL